MSAAGLAVGAQVAGTAISAISQSQALRGQAAARKEQGRQEFESARQQVRRDIGLQATEVASSGLLTKSFDQFFDAQAIDDAEFLSSIRQQTEFDVDNLRQASKNALIGGAFGAGASLLGGKAEIAHRNKLEEQAIRLNQSPGPIKQGLSPAGKSLFRNPSTASFF